MTAKYRGKAKNASTLGFEAGDWLYGSLINNAFFFEDGTPACSILDTNYLAYDCWEDWADWMDDFDVDPATVGQWTGLQDKDGTDIYQGDVIDIGVVPGKPRIGIVEWNQCYCSYVLHQQDPTFDDEFWGLGRSSDENSLTAYRILGNIHNNPEWTMP